MPVVLYGSGYWAGLIGWLRDRALAEGKVYAEDLGIFRVADDPDEVIAHIVEVLARRGPPLLPEVDDPKGEA